MKTVLPLEGLRVLDLGGEIGAYCTRLLADLGADVVLVEPPEGVRMRRLPPFKDGDPESSLLFAYYHASKRSVVGAPGDEAAVAALGAGADVVVVGPSPDRPLPGWDAKSASLSWAPNAVVCAITPFGLTGPQRDWRATPMVSHAAGGGMLRAGPPEGPPVAMPGRQLWDQAGLHAAIAILAALHVRPAVGPQSIDISVHEVATMRDFLVETYDVVGMSTLGRAVGVGLPPTGTYQCKDGPFDVAAHQLRHWEAFLAMLDHPDELTDPALGDAMVRRERFEELLATIQDLVGEQRRETLVARGQAAGLPCGMLNRPTEFVADKQLAARGSMVETPTPAGPMLMPGPGFRSTPNMAAARTSAPAEPGNGGGDVTWPARPHTPRTVPTPGARPLEGVKVLTFGVFVAGCTVGNLLAQLGADVVKIEARTHPEVLRMPAFAIGPVATEPSGVTNTIMNASLNRSMRNLSIEMGTEEGRHLFGRLVGVTDVVIENFGAGVMDRWGLGYEALLALNPSVVLTSLSGYGRTGPRSDYLAYASNISNFVGLTHAWGTNHGTHSDYVAAEHAVLGTLAALRAAADTGHGAHVDVAQIEAMAAIMPDLMLEALANGRDLPPPHNHVDGSLLSGVYRCAGHDAWLAVEVEDLARWARLCATVDLPVEATSANEAMELRTVLDASLVGWAAERTARSAARELQRIGVAASAAQSAEDIWHDPQLWSRGAVVALEQPDLGTWHYGGSPHRLSATPGRPTHAGRRLGQDTGAVLHEWLGMASDEVDGLVAKSTAFRA